MFKVYFLGNPEAGISCMAPEPYKERFQRKVFFIEYYEDIAIKIVYDRCPR